MTDYNLNGTHKYNPRPHKFFLDKVLAEFNLTALDDVPNEPQLYGSSTLNAKQEAKNKLRQYRIEEEKRVISNMYNMYIHETAYIGNDTSIQRVPGGIIYQYNYINSAQFVKL